MQVAYIPFLVAGPVLLFAVLLSRSTSSARMSRRGEFFLQNGTTVIQACCVEPTVPDLLESSFSK